MTEHPLHERLSKQIHTLYGSKVQYKVYETIEGLWYLELINEFKPLIVVERFYFQPEKSPCGKHHIYGIYQQKSFCSVEFCDDVRMNGVVQAATFSLASLIIEMLSEPGDMDVILTDNFPTSASDENGTMIFDPLVFERDKR